MVEMPPAPDMTPVREALQHTQKMIADSFGIKRELLEEEKIPMTDTILLASGGRIEFGGLPSRPPQPALRSKEIDMSFSVDFEVSPEFRHAINHMSRGNWLRLMRPYLPKRKFRRMRAKWKAERKQWS